VLLYLSEKSDKLFSQKVFSANAEELLLLESGIPLNYCKDITKKFTTKLKHRSTCMIVNYCYKLHNKGNNTHMD
jgi:hypothetical protein